MERVAKCAGALRLLGAVVAAVLLTAGVGAPAYAAANLVTNGSFETGDFTGWTQVGNTGFSGVFCPGAGSVPDGSCAGFFGPFGSDGGVQQTLATSAGTPYHISFYFGADPGSNPADFSVMFGTQTLFSVTNPAATPFTQLSFNTRATGASTALTFNFRDDPAFLYLDAVSVSVPEPGTLALLGIGLAGVWAGRRRRAT